MLHYFRLTIKDWHYLTEDSRLWYISVWNKIAGDRNVEAQKAKAAARKGRKGGRRR